MGPILKHSGTNRNLENGSARPRQARACHWLHLKPDLAHLPTVNAVLFFYHNRQ
jgi:hypothetical protein